MPRLRRPAPLGVALRAAARTGSGRHALLEEAVEVSRIARPARARARSARARRALRRAGRRAAAREPLREGARARARAAAPSGRSRAHDELVAAGARPRRDPIESRSHLTASELRVARMAADGLTNREIAQALFLTEKTIENHLRSLSEARHRLAHSAPARAPQLPEPAIV